MHFSESEQRLCKTLTQFALDEDLQNTGDLTSQAVVPKGTIGQAVFHVRVPGVLAGIPAAKIVCQMVDESLVFEQLSSDGTHVTPGTELAVVRGSMHSILCAERTALNFLQRLSGIATLTAAHAALIADLPCKLLDTRKTTPGWRLLEKYAVRMGGGHNHRMGLFDGVLIKDNHLAALGRTPDAVARAVSMARQRYGSSVPIEVEVDTLEQLDVALATTPDIVLLDNMTPDMLREAVVRRDRVAPGILLEASGGVNETTLRGIAETGVDRVSLGALTHSAKALDIGLDYLF